MSALSSRLALQVHVATFEEAPVLFRGLLGGGDACLAAAGSAKAAPKNAGLLSDDESLRLLKFTAGLYDRFKELRAEAREEGRPVPAYPSETERDFVVELLARKGLRRTA